VSQLLVVTNCTYRDIYSGRQICSTESIAASNKVLKVRAAAS
jgi:hypothetical protein